MSKHPTLKSIYYHITNRCNLKCRHCWVRAAGEQRESELSFAEAIGVVEQAVPMGLRTLKITGGEPFVVPWLMDFLEALVKRGITDVAFETNGTLISRNIADRLAQLRIGKLAISIDGSTASMHESIRMVPGCFERAVEGVRNLVRAGIRPGILMAVDKTNVKDVPGVTALASSLGATYVKYNVIQSVGRGQDTQEADQILGMDETCDLFQSIRSLEKGVSINVQMGFPPLLSPISHLRSHMCTVCDVKHTLGLLEDGRVAMCGIGHTIDQLVYGSIRQQPLRDIFESSHPILESVRALEPATLEGVCGRCLFKEHCKGGCRALAFQEYGSVNSPWPLCQKAFEAGKVAALRLPLASDSSPPAREQPASG